LIPFQEEEEQGNTIAASRGGFLQTPDSKRSSLIASAGKIAELLSATDISYL
jgi:hypothetical protein